MLKKKKGGEKPVGKSKGKSLREKLEAKKKELKSRGGGSKFVFFFKEGKTRVRIMNVGAENEFVYECTGFYLGKKLGGVTSPASIGKPCAIMEYYEKISKSKKEADIKLAKLLVPKPSYLTPVIVYKDEKGTEVDTDNSGRLAKIAKGVYESLIDLHLDDEYGDITATGSDGYDIKIIREGTGQQDTRYSVTPCKNSKAPKGYTKEVNLEEMVEKIIPSYEETEDMLNKFLSGGVDSDEDDEDENPKKNKLSKKKKKNSDL